MVGALEGRYMSPLPINLLCITVCNDGQCNSFSAELYVPLQRWYLGDRSGSAEAPVGPQSVHPAYGALHWQDNGAGQELRPPDHRQTHLHTVSNMLSLHLWTQKYRGLLIWRDNLYDEICNKKKGWWVCIFV